MRTAKFLLLGCVSIVTWTHAQVSSVVSAEYFFDFDPGTGAATALPTFSASQNVDVSFLATSSALAKGMHTLGIRVKDSKNLWSIPAYMPIYVLGSDPTTLQNISAAEYFFDTDPGTGSATAISVGAASPFVDFSFAAASAGLSLGMHTLAVRTRNSNGEWSIATYTPVYVSLDGTITKLEYFFDSDPGAGAASQLAVNPATDVLDQDFTMLSSGLAPGTHTLNVRVAGQSNLWSMPETATFVICDGATPLIIPDQVCAGSPTTLTDKSTVIAGDTYAWDFDNDGVIDNKSSGDQTYTYPVAGLYTATLSIDRGGCIATISVIVTVDQPETADAGPDLTICAGGTVNLECDLPGPTVFTGTWGTSGDGTFENSNAPRTDYTPGPNDVAAGITTVTFTTQDPVGACSAATSSVTITLNAKATAAAGPNLDVCTGSAVTLNGSIGGSATTATWVTAGDGFFDDENSLSTVYSPGPGDISNGAVDIHLSTDDPAGPCQDDGDEMVLNLIEHPAVEAGADITVCGNGSATLLAAAVGSPALTWSTMGDGAFSDPTIPDPDYTPGPNDLATGAVILTVTTDASGPCPADSDELTLSVSKDIVLDIQSSDATIGVSTVVTVTDGGVFNPGDVLVSSIVGSPKKGSALLSGEMLQYTANSGTVGKDSVQIQVCNQCDQCDTGFVYFSILNKPPAMNVPASTTNKAQALVIPIASTITDENANVDLSTITIVQQPVSGAVAHIDESHNLVVDYNGRNFSGADHLTVEVCDDLGACVQSVITIQVNNSIGEILVHNAVAPNSSGDNRFMRILNLPPGNKVTVYNRWGDNVFEMKGYDHTIEDRRFAGRGKNGQALPSGIYFYRIETDDGILLTGYVSLRQ